MKGRVRYYGCPAEEGGAAKAFMVREGIDPVGSTPAEAAAFYDREITKFATVVRVANVKPE